MTKRALLIGIDHYPLLDTEEQRNLEGCGNDVRRMEQLLIEGFDFEPRRVRVLASPQGPQSGRGAGEDDVHGRRRARSGRD